MSMKETFYVYLYTVFYQDTFILATDSSMQAQ